METKVCKTCGKEKDATNFQLYKKYNRYDKVCKKCKSDQKYDLHNNSISPVTGKILCKRCGEEKPQDDFSKSQIICRSCKSKEHNERSKIINAMEKRVCTKCKKEKTSSEFYKGMVECKECKEGYRKIYHNTLAVSTGTRFCTICKKEKDISEFRKNKVHCKECDKKHEHERRVTISQNRTHCKACKIDKNTNSSQKTRYCGECKIDPIEIWLIISLDQHAKKGIIINTTPENIKKNNDLYHCNICDKPLNITDINNRYQSPTLDRTNNEQHIDINNIQIVCRDCNVMKNDRSMDDYLKYLNNLTNKKFSEISKMHFNHTHHKTSDVWKQWATATKNYHIQKGYNVDITVNDITNLFILTPTRPICGCILKRGIGASHGNSPTLDRINNKRGTLTLEDVWIICHRCNTSKQHFTLSEWKEYAEKVCNLWEQRHPGEKLIDGYNSSKTTDTVRLSSDITEVSDYNEAHFQGVEATM